MTTAMARQALEQGNVLPLRAVLEKIEHDYQGQTLRVEFEQHDMAATFMKFDCCKATAA